MPTKEQVLKRMAEIEGISRDIRNCEVHEWGCCWYDADGTYRSWNPLDTPADWAVLIEKYKLWIDYNDDGTWRARPHEAHPPWVRHESLPWAICLAVIEANGGMGDE